MGRYQSDVFIIRVCGRELPAALVRRVKKRRICRNGLCWEERYAVRYIPKELEPGDGEVLIIVKIDEKAISETCSPPLRRTS